MWKGQSRCNMSVRSFFKTHFDIQVIFANFVDIAPPWKMHLEKAWIAIAVGELRPTVGILISLCKINMLLIFGSCLKACFVDIIYKGGLCWHYIPAVGRLVVAVGEPGAVADRCLELLVGERNSHLFPDSVQKAGWIFPWHNLVPLSFSTWELCRESVSDLHVQGPL